jgi:hypothetical protein
MGCSFTNLHSIAPAPYSPCAVLPANRSSACGSSGSTARSELSAPAGLPGKLTISEAPSVPQTPRPSAANGVCFAPSARISSANPGTSLSHTESVASGVTSRGPSPVPPVVTTSALAAAAVWIAVTMCLTSSGTTTATQSIPASAKISRSAGPERSICVPAKHRSLTVMTVAVRPSSVRSISAAYRKHVCPEDEKINSSQPIRAIGEWSLRRNFLAASTSQQKPMLFTETPTEPKPLQSDTEPLPPAQQPIRVAAGRHGELDTHELIRLLDTIEDERARGRFRESLYISIFVWIAVAWFIFYGPRVLWHRAELRDPASVLKERELVELQMPQLPHLPTPTVKPVHPVIDNKTMAHLRETAPTPAPQPVTPQPQPVPAAPPTPPPPPVTNAPSIHTPPPIVADAPSALPHFTQPSSAGSNIQGALNAAARDHTSVNIGNLSRPGRPLNLGGAEVLSDMEGVDFTAYLRRLVSDVQRNWDPLLPPEAGSPLFKQGESYIRFTILPDGTIKDASMHLDGSTHDEAINRSAWGSITSEGQFPPLPKNFHGPEFVLRLHFLVNKQPQE